MAATALHHDFSIAQKIYFGKPLQETGFSFASFVLFVVTSFSNFSCHPPLHRANFNAKKARREGRAFS